MKLSSILGIRGARDKPKDSFSGPAYSFFFGRSISGKTVNERTAMQITAIYSCVRILPQLKHFSLPVLPHDINSKVRKIYPFTPPPVTPAIIFSDRKR